MQNDAYFRIRINTIVPGKPLTFDLHLTVGEQKIVYVRSGDKLSQEKINRLDRRDRGDYFLVKNEDKQAYRDFVHEQIRSGDLMAKEKALILRESALMMVEDLYENPDVHKALESARPLITDFMQFMETEPQAMAYMISLSGHDFYTYNHSLDVSIYSLGLAESLGFAGKELEELGVGALYHDIGKRQVSLDILCKKGPLNDVEWSQMQKHPQFGLSILRDHEGLSDGVIAACFEHHESWSGNGYPQQLVGDEIHPFARIVAITDTFDAMTTQRSYNTPLSPTDAVTMMKEKLKGRYDPEMINAMYSVLFKMKAA